MKGIKKLIKKRKRKIACLSSCPFLVLDWNQTRLQILKIFSIFWNHWAASIPWLCFIVIIYILIFIYDFQIYFSDFHC